MRTSRRVPGVLSVVGALVAGVLLAGCGVATGGGPHAIASSRVPYDLLAPAPPTTTTTTVPSVFTVPVNVYFVSATGQYLVPSERLVRSSATLTTVLEALLAGPTVLEEQKGLRTAFDGNVKLIKARLTPTVATVDFNQAFDQISGTELVLAVAQVVYTVTGKTSQNIGVQFEIAGQPKEVPTATGAEVPGPVHLQQYLTLTPGAPPSTTTAPSTTTTTTTPVAAAPKTTTTTTAAG